MKKLTFATPPTELVDAYLEEIAKGYGVNWTAHPKTDDDDSIGGGGLKVSELRPLNLINFLSLSLFHFYSSSRYRELLMNTAKNRENKGFPFNNYELYINQIRTFKYSFLFK